MCRLSAFVVASVTDPTCWAARYTVKSFLVVVALAPKSKVLAQRSPPATRKADLLMIDRTRPTYHTRAETSRGLLINAHNWQTFVFYALTSEPRYRVFVKPPILPKYHPHPIATLGQPRIRSYVFEADMYAADVLRNDKIKLRLLKHLDRNIRVVPSYFLITRPI